MNWKLVGIVGLGLVLRLVWLDKLPAGFTADEAGQGYAAYSLLRTGKDEWGEWWPLFPRGFGDFKAPLYTWLTVPSVAIFGLNEWTVRLPEVIVGAAAIGVVYLLAKELFSTRVGLWAALLLAISPWHVALSRNAWEGGVGVLLFAGGLYLWLKKRWGWALAIWGVNLYAYHSWRVVTLLFAAFVLGREKRWQWLPVLLIFLAPILLNLNQSLARAGDVSILSADNISNYFKNKGTSSAPPFVARLFDNKYIYVANQFWANYTTYFSPTFFFTGQRPDSSHLNFPGTPLLYPIEIASVGVGLYLLLTKKHKYGSYLLAWALLAPVPAALTDGWYAQRAITWLPLVTIVSAQGADRLVTKYRWGKVWLGLLGLLFLFYGYSYLYQLPARPIYSQRVEYKQIFTTAIGLENEFDSIHFSRRFSVPHIFVAFYKKWNPVDFQQQATDWLRYERADKRYVDQLESYNLGKYEFHDIDWQRDRSRSNALLIGGSEDFPAEVRSIADIAGYRFVPTPQ